MGNLFRLAVLMVIVGVVINTFCDAKRNRNHRRHEGEDDHHVGEHSGGNSVHDGPHKENEPSETSNNENHIASGNDGLVEGSEDHSKRRRPSHRRRHRNRKTTTTTSTTGVPEYTPYLGE